MAKIDIWGVPFSNYVWSVRIACAEKGVACELHRGLPQSTELAAHPMGKMPVMTHGGTTLFETKAILAYVDRAFEGPALTPADPLGAAQVEQWCSYVNTAVDPAVMRAFVVPLAFGKPSPEAVAAAVEGVKRQYAIMDGAVAATGFLVGERFTMADMLLVPILASANRYPQAAEALDACGSLKEYLQTHLARASVTETAPPFRK